VKFCMWSAGSTGVPKGVLCCHEGLINAMDFEISMRHKCGLGNDDPVMQTMAVFADMSGKWFALYMSKIFLQSILPSLDPWLICNCNSCNSAGPVGATRHGYQSRHCFCG
jgi:acyl-CoA synthetase (AMP-forming)/AMP-acid ligase II